MVGDDPGVNSYVDIQRWRDKQEATLACVRSSLFWLYCLHMYMHYTNLLFTNFVLEIPWKRQLLPTLIQLILSKLYIK